MIKLAINSKKPLNTLQQPSTMNSKIQNNENEITIPSLNSKRNESKAKFTVLRSPKLSKHSLSNASLPSRVNSVTRRETRKPVAVRKSNISTSVAKIMPVNKILITDTLSINKKIQKRRNEQTVREKLVPGIVSKEREISNVFVQTNENEILNHLLIVGDFKFMTASKSVTDEIDKMRKEKEAKNILMATRKFEEHSQKDEQHLDDLKEFLDKNFITRKPPKLPDNILEEDRKLIESMDELLQRDKPKTESITDIRSRIKQKEQELLSLFDHFQKKNGIVGKANI